VILGVVRFVSAVVVAGGGARGGSVVVDPGTSREKLGSPRYRFRVRRSLWGMAGVWRHVGLSILCLYVFGAIQPEPSNYKFVLALVCHGGYAITVNTF